MQGAEKLVLRLVTGIVEVDRLACDREAFLAVKPDAPLGTPRIEGAGENVDIVGMDRRIEHHGHERYLWFEWSVDSPGSGERRKTDFILEVCKIVRALALTPPEYGTGVVPYRDSVLSGPDPAYCAGVWAGGCRAEFMAGVPLRP
jgi:hypothetical protein